MRNVLIEDPQVSFLKKQVENLEAELNYYKSINGKDQKSIFNHDVHEVSNGPSPVVTLPLFAHGGYEPYGHGYQVFAKTTGEHAYGVKFYVSHAALYAGKWTRAGLLKELLSDALETLMHNTGQIK